MIKSNHYKTLVHLTFLCLKRKIKSAHKLEINGMMMKREIINTLPFCVTDFAVGAPYDGVTGRGAVYIFQGSSTGVRKEFTQVPLIRFHH